MGLSRASARRGCGFRGRRFFLKALRCEDWCCSGMDVAGDERGRGAENPLLLGWSATELVEVEVRWMEAESEDRRGFD